MSSLTYLLHSQLNHSISLTLNSIQLSSSSSSSTTPPTTDLYCQLQLNSNENIVTIPFHSKFRSSSSSNYITFNQLITFPLAWKDLSLSSSLSITVYNHDHQILGGTTLSLFNSTTFTLKKGKQRCYLWPALAADPNVATTTPSKVTFNDEMGRLEKCVKEHERGDLIRMDWLDKLAFRQIEKIHAAESEKSENMFLYIDMPRFDFPVVFSEPEYPSTMASSSTPQQSTSTSSSHRLENLFTIIDPEIVRDNPVEAKHRRLVRSHRNGPLDRELKPNAKIRDELNDILSYSPTQSLTFLQRDLIWQFRFYLTRDKRALTKFLKSVVWSDRGEVKQAVETLLPMWAEVEMDDALELLGPGEGFRDRRVRGHAVTRLRKADDEELMLYLLQLVQALKFEPAPIKSPATSIRSSRTIAASTLSYHHQSLNLDQSLDPDSLEHFLIERAAANPVLGNHFYWYLRVECEDKIGAKVYEKVGEKFKKRIAELQSPNEPDRLDLLRRQTDFIVRISKLAKELRLSKDARPKKIDRLQSILRDPKSHLGSFLPIPLPLDAKTLIIGIEPDHSSVFKSNLFPLKLNLICQDSSHYPVIFKNGDDLRQDQLVIQLFTLMDKLLRKENLDLKLMPYKVLATGAVDGMVQFVQGRTIAEIASEWGGSLGNYLRSFHPDPGSVGTFGIESAVLDTFVRSCAGYCVVTYLLGVGDRHLDNLLLAPDGHFFHVDFGYILGRDPKPFPPAIKVCKEMVDLMGGTTSPHYLRFKSLCFTGFSSLRKSSNLIVNLVALMVEAGIQDFMFEPDKVVDKVQDKFLLNLSEEEAIKVFDTLLNETSYFTSVLDVIHSVAQYYRA